MGHTRASNRHTTPPTHTGALSYSRECVYWRRVCSQRKFSTVSGSSSCIDRRRRHPKTGSIPFRVSIQRFGSGREESACANGPLNCLNILFVVIKPTVCVFRVVMTLNKQSVTGIAIIRCFRNDSFNSSLS